jgi:hypothetical protein
MKSSNFLPKWFKGYLYLWTLSFLEKGKTTKSSVFSDINGRQIFLYAFVYIDLGLIIFCVIIFN